MRLVWFAFLVALLCAASGCSDDSLGASPGFDNYVEPDDDVVSSDWILVGDRCVKHGRVAADARTGTAWVVQSVRASPCNGVPRRTLWAVPLGGEPVRIMDVTRREDVRVTFPEDRVLVMAEEGGLDQLYFLDPHDLRITAKLSSRAQYFGSRTSPTRRFVTVADDKRRTGALHVIDTREFVTIAIPHNGEHIEARWLNHRDMLVAVVFYGRGADNNYARVLAWDFDETTERPLYREVQNGLWADPDINIRVDDVVPAATAPWLDVRDDDTWLSLLARGRYGDAIVLNLDLESEQTTVSRDVNGPTAWIADGRLTGWRFDAVGAQVVAIDPATGIEEPIGVLPGVGRPSLVPHPSANHLIAYQEDDLESFTVIDVARRSEHRLFVRHDALAEAAALGDDDVYFIARQQLKRVDLQLGTLGDVPVGFVRHMSPTYDGKLILTSGSEPVLIRLDPETMEQERVYLPLDPDEAPTGPTPDDPVP